MIEYYQKRYKDWDERYKVAIVKASLYSCLFNDFRKFSWFEEQCFLMFVYFKLYETCPFVEGTDGFSILFNLGESHKLVDNIRNPNSDAHFLFNSIYFTEKNNLYNEILLTQTLNILQLAEHKGLWEEIASKSSTASRLKNEYGFDDEVFVIKKLRNSFQHIRYVKEKESLLIYDGKDKDSLEFQFEIFIDELEEIKDCALKVLTEYNKAQISALETSTCTTDESEDEII